MTARALIPTKFGVRWATVEDTGRRRWRKVQALTSEHRYELALVIVAGAEQWIAVERLEGHAEADAWREWDEQRPAVCRVEA
jgi:DNA-binding PadR family transcriptional regulator